MKKAGSATKTGATKEKILSWYMQDMLEGKDPKNVYFFSKSHGIEENVFYQFFNSFDGIERHYFKFIFTKTIDTLKKAPQYKDYQSKEKLLSFYYTFFGNLTANRSFVLQLLNNNNKWDNIRKLSGVHKEFLNFVRELDIEKPDLKNKELNKIQSRTMEEAAWIQFVSILKFWLHDNSADFEKTDILIEKSVIAGFELINIKPLKSVVDLGKFIFKEMNPVG